MTLLSTWPRRTYRRTLLPALSLLFPAPGQWAAWPARTTNKFLLHKDTGFFSCACSPLSNSVWLCSPARDFLSLGRMRQRRHPPPREILGAASRSAPILAFILPDTLFN